VGEWCNETDLLTCFLKPDIAGGPAGPVGEVSDGVAFRELLADVRNRPVLAESAFIAEIAHGHDLDPREIHALRRAPFGHREKLVLIEAFQCDGVDLDPQASRTRRLDALQNLPQAAPSGYAGEPVRVESVERNVYAAHAGRVKVRRESVKLRTVGGQRKLLQRATFEMARHGPEERDYIFSHKRFATGDAELPDAKSDEGRAEPVQFLKREELPFRKERHVLRHAVDAAEIAAVGDRDAQIGDGAGEWIDKRWCHFRNLGSNSGHRKPPTGIEDTLPCNYDGDMGRFVSVYLALSLTLAIAGCGGVDLRSASDPSGGTGPDSDMEMDSSVAVADAVSSLRPVNVPAAIEATLGNGGVFLGTTVASLGDPSRAGLWVKTPLVGDQVQGHVHYSAGNRSVRVDLIPSGGAAGTGSQVSLMAMRLLDAPLGDLLELAVYSE